jgi:hypothetical protein
MRVSVLSFTHLLDDCARLLEPFIRSARRGSFSWNGVEYTPVTEDAEPDPYALAWGSTLRSTSALLASQPTLSPEQYSYLQQQLFGGMGSLTDFCLDTKRWEKKPKWQTSS